MTGTDVGDPTAAAKSIEERSSRRTTDEHRVRMLLSAARGCQWRQRNRSGEERESKQIFVSEHKKRKTNRRTLPMLVKGF